MTAFWINPVLENISRVAAHAGSTAYYYMAGEAVVRFDDLEQEALETAIATLPPLLPTADDVRAEAQRRIMLLTGASDLQSTIIKQLNAQMRASELTFKLATGVALSEAEQAEAAALQAMAAGIKAIRAASNVLEPSPPVDFRNDTHWP